MNALHEILKNRAVGRQKGICSVCSASDLVLRAALEMGRDTGTPVLIEATANQVNQFGGYTGLRPADFYAHVQAMREKVGLPEDQLLLGGDHLGPLTWKDEPEESAMGKAEELIRLFAEAGYQKIHIDTSMRLGDDDPAAPLPVETVARRSARLARAAEDAFAARRARVPNAVAPVYVVGSEVPIPGGAQGREDVEVTSPEAFLSEVRAFRDAYLARGLAACWDRVVAVVVQPGVEFSDDQVCAYDPAKARDLIAALKDAGGVAFEGHSTDYQTKACLRAMVDDGVAILKVGPALTFALREALFALEGIEGEMGAQNPSRFRAALEKAMLDRPETWKKYYRGTEDQIALKRRFSYSDRCRYVLGDANVQGAAAALIRNVDASNFPLSVLSQYMPVQYAAVRAGRLQASAEALIVDHIKDCLRDYWYAALRD